ASLGPAVSPTLQAGMPRTRAAARSTLLVPVAHTQVSFRAPAARISAASSTTLLLTTTVAPAIRCATSSGRVWSYSCHSGKLCSRPVKSISAGRRVPVSRNTPFMDYSEFSFAPPSRLDAWLNSLRLGHADDKPRIAVSACLTGQPVRYDGGDRYDGTVARVLRRWLLLQEYCPEI